MKKSKNVRNDENSKKLCEYWEKTYNQNLIKKIVPTKLISKKKSLWAMFPNNDKNV